MLELFQSLQNNPIVTGGVVLTAGGILIRYCKSVPLLIFNQVKKEFTITIELNSDHALYQSFNIWLSQRKFLRNKRLISITSAQRGIGIPGQIGTLGPDAIDENKSLKTIPAPGIHYFFYKNKFCVLSKSQKESKNNPFGEQYYLNILSRDTKIVDDIINELSNIFFCKDSNKIKLFRINMYSDAWQEDSFINKRFFDSIILPKDNKNDIIKDIDNFISKKDWYNNLSIPYKRGYILYGPPGNGKSSIVHAIASTYNKNIYKINLSSSSLNDDKLHSLISELDSESLLLLEDIDCIFEKRQAKNDNKISFSGLLNALDGIGNSNGQLIFLTTNYKDKLDSSLIRPGRCDKHYYIANPSKQCILEFINRFRPNINEHIKYDLAEKLASLQASGAFIQGFLLAYLEHDEKELVNNVDKYIETINQK